MKKNFFTMLCILFLCFEGISQNYRVVSFSKTFKDSRRSNRSVATKIYYPVSTVSNQPNVPFPVIVLGHGFVMGSDAYQNFYDNLVPRGYIVVFVNTEGSVFANHDAYSKDLAFMVGAIQAENTNASSVLYGKVANKSALLGHSMGGGAATVAASLTQVETLVTFAPAQLRFNTLTPASNVTEESIVFSGTSDGVTPPSENHLPIYNNLGSTCKYFISITGGAHCYFANPNSACDFGERTSSNNIQITRAQQHQTTFRFLNSWLDYKLKGDLTAKQIFANDLVASVGITYLNGCSQNTLDTSVSKQQAYEIELYPNPTLNDVYIKTTKEELFEKADFYNEYGQLLLTSKKDKVDVSTLQSGQYIVKIYTKNGVASKRMIIQK